MSAQSTIYQWLATSEDLTNLIGSRLYPLSEPEAEELSARQEMTVVYKILRTTHEPDIMQQHIKEITKAVFYCAAATYDDAHSVADALVSRCYAGLKQSVSDKRIEDVGLVDLFDDDAQSDIKAGIFVVYAEFDFQIQ